MWWLLLFLVVGYFAWAKKREGMSPSASEMNLMQVGEIQKLDEQLSAFKLTQEMVDALETCVDTNIDNASAVQANMKQTNTNESPNAYPIEPV
jgi:hypothetical protein